MINLKRLAFWILLAVGLSFGASCSKDSIPLEFQEISSLDEAKAAFSKIPVSDLQRQGVHADWRQLAKNIRWDAATWDEKDGGLEIVIPVDLPGTFSVYSPLDSTVGAAIKTRLWIRRLGDGAWDFKLLTNLPDHLQSQESGFSGMVLAEDWLTGQIVYAVYQGGRVLSKLEWARQNLQMGLEYQCHDKYVIGCVNDICRPYYVGQACDWYYVGENETLPPPDEGGIGGIGGGGGGGGNPNPNTAGMSDQDMEDIAGQLIDPITGDPIELYLVLKLNNPDKLKLSTSSQGDPIQIGDYVLVPHKNSQGQIVYYAASRQGTNGIEYIVDAQGLSSFQAKIDLYTAAADLFYQGGIPTNSMIQVAAGNTLNSRIEGLASMWGDALTSTEWWAYTATAYLHGVTLPATIAAKGVGGLLKAGNALDQGGFTAVGRALQKHGSRTGSIFPKATGNVAAINAQGEAVLNGILTNPNATNAIRHHARFGNVLEYRIPGGQGARFSGDGKTFIGFLE